MPANILGIPFQLSPEQMGSSDLIGALQKGLQFGAGARELPLDIKSKQLANILQQAKADVAPQMENADLREKLARAGLNEQQSKYYGQNIQSEINSRNAAAALNDFYRKNPQYLNAEGYLLSSPAIKQALAGGNQQLPSSDQATQLSQSQQPAAQQTQESLDPNIYYGQEPRSAYNTGNPIQDALLNKVLPSPETAFNKQRALEDYKTNTDEYAKLLPKLGEKSENSNGILSDLNQFNNAYDAISLAKGPALGYLPAVSNEADIADRVSQRLQNEEAKNLQGNQHITNRDFDIVARSKVGRKMPEESKNQFVNIFKSGALRSQEEQQFMAEAANMKIKPSVAREAWNIYQRQRPGMNQDSGEQYMNNAYLGTYKDYLTPQALNSIVRTGNYIPPNQKDLAKQNIKTSDIKEMAKKFNVSTSEVMKMIERPEQIPDDYLKYIPTNILLEMRKHSAMGR